MADDDSFADAVGDVQPLRRQPRADTRSAPLPDAGLARRRAAAISESAGHENFLSTEHAPQLGPHDIIEFRRAGVQHGVYGKLRRGQYEVEASLDLHRKTVEQARVELWGFLDQCMSFGLRTVMVLHGKGDRNPQQPATIKSYSAKWLKEMPAVLAYHSAQARHGGAGALYVLLKKSASARDENRERHKKHRTKPK